MRVLIPADRESVTGITNTNELMFGRVHYEFMRGMMTDDVNAAADAWRGFFAVLLLGRSATNEVYG